MQTFGIEGKIRLAPVTCSERGPLIHNRIEAVIGIGNAVAFREGSEGRTGHTIHTEELALIEVPRDVRHHIGRDALQLNREHKGYEAIPHEDTIRRAHIRAFKNALPLELVTAQQNGIFDGLMAGSQQIIRREMPMPPLVALQGAGVDGGAIRFAKEHGADVIVSSDVKHNYICDILESGMRLVVLTHYASENYGFKKIYQKIGDKLGVPAYYHEDGFML